MRCACLRSAKISEKNGKACLGETELELVWARQNIRIKYSEIVRLAYEKTVGSEDGWSFLSVCKLTIYLKEGREQRIFSSRHEAWQRKRERGPNNSAPVPEALLWHVASELGKRAGLAVMVSEEIESRRLLIGNILLAMIVFRLKNISNGESAATGLLEKPRVIRGARFQFQVSPLPQSPHPLYRKKTI